jgi:hypothetical protein
LALASVSLRQEGETRAALVQSTTELARHRRDLWADFKTKSPLDFASFFQVSFALVLSDAAAAILCFSLDRNWPIAFRGGCQVMEFSGQSGKSSLLLRAA